MIKMFNWNREDNILKQAVERMKALPTRELPRNVLDRWFYVSLVPKDKDGENVPEWECAYLEFQVWDNEGLCLHTTRRLQEAIQKAEDLNWEMINGPSKQAEQPKGQRGDKEGPVLYGTLGSNG